MKKVSRIISGFILIGLACSLYGKKNDSHSAESFIKPSQDRRYDQVCWLKTHNAYSAERYGYVYANQYYTIDEQLERGVRGFEIDTYRHRIAKHRQGSEACTVSMCHGKCDVSNKWIYKPWKPGNEALCFVNHGLSPIKKFLEKHPDEIITIQLENYVAFDHGAHEDMLDEYIESSGIAPLVLRPQDWDPSQQGWPPLAWMIQNNKRLVIFNDKPSTTQTKKQEILNRPYASTKYTYYQWKTIVQNQWGGAKDINKALQERINSVENRGVKRFLLELDWYPDGGKILGGPISDVINKCGRFFGDEKRVPFGGNFKKLNGSDLQLFLQRAREQGLQPSGIGKNRYPNFIKVDYFHEGNPSPLSMVNEINARANDPRLRDQMFGPMQ